MDVSTCNIAQAVSRFFSFLFVVIRFAVRLHRHSNKMTPYSPIQHIFRISWIYIKLAEDIPLIILPPTFLTESILSSLVIFYVMSEQSAAAKEKINFAKLQAHLL